MEQRVSARNFLAGLSPEHFEAFRSLMRPIDLVDGELLCRQGESATRAWFVDEGRVAMNVRLPGGASVRVAEARSGEVLGELGLMTDARRTADLRAEGPLRVYSVERDDFRGLLSYYHPAGLGVLRRLAALVAERIHQSIRLVHALDGIQRPPRGTEDEPAPGGEEEQRADFDYRPFLPALPLFEGFAQYDIDAFLARTGPRPWLLPRGHVVCPTGLKPRACYIVVRGAVELSVGDSSSRRRLGVVGPGAVVGVEPLSIDRRRLAEARVREDALLLEVGAETLREILDEGDRLAFKLLAGIFPQLARWLESINHVVSRLQRERRGLGEHHTPHDPGTEIGAGLQRARLLVVDDDATRRDRLAASLRTLAQEVEAVGGEDASRARRSTWDAILVDAAAADTVLGRGSSDPIFVLGAEESLDEAVRLVRQGAYDVLHGDTDAKRITGRVQAVLQRDQLRG
ncbi:MAG TPA: hypothetical protein DEF51_03730 [Myxococcales bacterium]|nr:hypothetical protein [Myxococcales bacterium]